MNDLSDHDAYDIIVIGGGEAGISAALRATELGAEVLTINREPEFGGAHVVGQDASETIRFAALAIKLGSRAEDIKDMVFNHPTVSEGFGKAAADVLKKLELRKTS